MKYFSVVSNTLKDPVGIVANEICEYIKSKGAECSIYNLDEKCNAECVIVLGGDGTLLRTSKELIESSVLIMGINIGTLGFLTDADMDTYKGALDKVINNEFEVDERRMIKGSIYRDGEIIYEDISLNDIVINRYGNLRVIDFDISVNGDYLNSYSADGVIVSTATGSTAYSLSAGGPIIHPNAELIMVTPICPHTLNKRSIIFGAKDVVTITMKDNKKLKEERVATFDGDNYYNVITNDKIVISQSNDIARFIKTNKDTFLQRVRTKLM